MREEKVKILRDVLGDFHIVGHEHLFHCPFCEHQKRKLSVNIDKNAYKCWICDKSGKDIYQLIKLRGTEKQKFEWQKLTMTFDHSETTLDNLFHDEVKEVVKLMLPESFVSLAGKQHLIKRREAKQYLIDRGLTELDILKWKIGFVDDEEYFNRILIPSFDKNGELNYFVTRAYRETQYNPYRLVDAPKDIIFNEINIDWKKPIILTEGVFDAVRVPNSVPILGSTLQPASKLFAALVRNNAKVIMALDQDAKSKENKIIETLLSYGLETYKMNTNGYGDLGEMPQTEIDARLKNIQHISMENYLIKNLFARNK